MCLKHLVAHLVLPPFKCCVLQNRLASSTFTDGNCCPYSFRNAVIPAGRQLSCVFIETLSKSRHLFTLHAHAANLFCWIAIT